MFGSGSMNSVTLKSPKIGWVKTVKTVEICWVRRHPAVRFGVTQGGIGAAGASFAGWDPTVDLSAPRLCQVMFPSFYLHFPITDMEAI